MKLIGQLNKCFGSFVTLRGFAKMGDIEKISSADGGYQRDLYPDHRDVMANFLKGGEYTFFPELILSIAFNSTNEKNEGEMDCFYNTILELGETEPVKNLSVVETSSFTLKATTSTLFRKGVLTTHDNPPKRILQRIDGNHRLSATKEAGKEDLLVPFCIIFLRYEEDKFNRVFFNNINYKQLPLTPEENLKIIFGENKTLNEPFFSDDELKDPVWFGPEYIEARRLYNAISLDDLSNIEEILQKEGADKFTRTLLLEFSKIYKKTIKVEKFKKALKAVDQCYSAYENKQGYQLLIVHLYYYFANALDSFSNWVKENYIYNLKVVSPQGLIDIFDKLRGAKKRTIFLAMDFGDDANENHNAIDSAIKEINKSRKSDTKLKLIRIDKSATGYSFNITDKILKYLEEGAYLIADISLGNRNVYYEIGYQMGLNTGRGLKHENFLLVHNSGVANATFEQDKIFSISHIKVIATENKDDLQEKVKKQIEIYYKK